MRPPDRTPVSSTRRRATRAAALPVAAALAGGLLTACGSDAGALPVITWYINNNQQEALAQRCSEESDTYSIDTVLLPAAASGQREQLLRRLAASDSSVDIMSLDPPFMAEFANAGFLRPFTEEERAEFSEGVLEGPLEASLFDDRMFSAPFYGNTQLLWYRKSVAEAAGLDMSQPVTWDQIIAAAEETGTTVAAQGRRNESLMVWVNALVESTGGTILEEAGENESADQVEPAIDAPPGARAAEIMSTLARSEAAPPALSTAGEEESRAAFQSENGGFMVNWPYVWAAFGAAEESGELPEGFREDVGWARYPRVDPEQPSATPLGGIGLSVGAYTEHPELAVDAVRCLRSVESQTEYMLTAGDPAASAAVYEDPEVREAFPMWEQIRTGLVDAAPRPITPYYGDVTGVIQAGYHPPDELVPAVTPDATAALMKGVLTNSQLL